jgi:hypothetical protein
MKHRRVLAVIGLILVLGVGVVFNANVRGFFHAIVVAPPGVCGRPFSAAEWQSKHATEGERSIRSQMADELISSRRLIGMSKLQVAKLLGEPGAASHDNVSEYVLGPERGWGVDYETLRITFDRSGEVVKAEISAN